MSTFPGSPKILKGGIVVLDPIVELLGLRAGIGPDELSRRLMCGELLTDILGEDVEVDRTRHERSRPE